MPRLYFDTRQGQRFVHDADGQEFDSLQAAEAEAAATAFDLARNRMPRGCDLPIMVEVRYADGEQVFAVTVSMEVRRIAPTPD